MNLLLPRGWETKPPAGTRIDWSHPLAKNLANCWLFNEAGGAIARDAVGVHHGTISGVNSDILWAPSRNGMTIRPLAHAGTSRVSIPSLASGTVWSWATRIRPMTLTDSWQVLLTQGGGNGMWLRLSGTFWFEFGTGNTLSNATIVAGNEYAIVLTSDGATVNLYLNGLLDKSEADAAPSISFDNMFNNAGSETFDGFCDYQMFWRNRILSHAEVRQLLTSPYDFFLKPGLRVLIPSGAPPGTAAPAAFDPVMLGPGWFDDEFNIDALFDPEFGRAAGGGNALTLDLADSITLGDSRVGQPNKALSDAATLADAIIKMAGLVKGDSITLGEARAMAVAIAKSDAATLADVIAKMPGKVLSDSITLADSATAILLLVKSLSDSITLADALTKNFGKNLSDSITLNEARAMLVGLAKSDSISLADAIVKMAGKNLTDALTLGDSIAASLVILKSLSDSITLGDAILKTAGKSLTDSISFADARTMATSIFKSDAIALNEAIAKLTGKALTDSITLADSVVASLVVLKALTDSISLADAIAKQAQKNLADSISMADAVTRAVQTVRIDTLTLADPLAFFATKSFADSISLIDAVTFFLGTPPAFAVRFLGAGMTTGTPSTGTHASSTSTGRHSSDIEIL